jgi:hypothetical protein
VEQDRFSKLIACADFKPWEHRGEECGICLQPKEAHPQDDDAVYWAQWTVFHSLLELTCG